MRVVKRDGSKERIILIGMIVDKVVIGRIAAKWTKYGLFKSKWSNLVGEWCVKYFLKYKKAPGNKIKGLFDTWAEDSKDEDATSKVEVFLQSIDDEYRSLRKESNSEYVLDLANDYFDEVSVKKLSEALDADLSINDLVKAVKRIQTFGKVEINQSAFIDVLHNKQALKNAFTKKGAPVITYPGALGEFFGSELQRDAFISLMGPEKRGKTYWLMEFAWAAMSQGRKVAFFEVGDMSQHQMEYRWGARAARHPINIKGGILNLQYPKYLVHDAESDSTVVTHENKVYNKKLAWPQAWRAFQKQSKKQGGKTLLKLACYPNSSISVNGVVSAIQTLERDDWIPDVIIIDYADILAPVNGTAETRDQINATWKGMRAISQTYHSLTITATQSNAESYKTDMLDMSNFSEDKRKFSHVTGMIGLNQTRSEKADGLMRLNWIVLRNAGYEIQKSVYVAGNLSLGRPYILSTF